jgi:hypothetical protein
VIAVATSIGMITCIVSIIAASSARKRRALVESGFLRTRKYPSDGTPLLKKPFDKRLMHALV